MNEHYADPHADPHADHLAHHPAHHPLHQNLKLFDGGDLSVKGSFDAAFDGADAVMLSGESV